MVWTGKHQAHEDKREDAFYSMQNGQLHRHNHLTVLQPIHKSRSVEFNLRQIRLIYRRTCLQLNNRPAVVTQKSEILILKSQFQSRFKVLLSFIAGPSIISSPSFSLRIPLLHCILQLLNNELIKEYQIGIFLLNKRYKTMELYVF